LTSSGEERPAAVAVRRSQQSTVWAAALRGSSWIGWQHFVDVRRGNRRVARGDGDLVQIRYNVAGGIQAFDRGLLMLVDLQATELVGLGAQISGKLRTGPVPDR
jgi:hypothetical protein